MIVLENVLSDKLLANIEEELSDKLQSHCWSANHLQWEEYLFSGLNGSVLIAPVSENKEELQRELFGKLPESKLFTPNFHVWLRGSGINTHADTNHKYGATLFLNPEWEYDWGGLFCWENNNNIETIIPKINTLVLNDKYEKHFVTQVSANCPQMRITIQIWGDDNVPRS